MSRRDSRASLNARQNDALNEFENFKKKFLLANKHITKLNSTLSVRIEELNAQISTLYVENLRLRASEIALAAQLKREQEKSRKIMADAEAATSNLSKHLHFLRQSLNIASGTPSPTTQAPPQPRARRPVINTNSSPQVPRLSRAPNVPGIYEDEELASSPEVEDDEAEHVPSPTIRRKAKGRLSASRLPLPSRVSSPPPLPTPLHVNLQERGAKRKTGRRQSGMLTVDTDVAGFEMVPPRASSPAFGSPARREAGLAEDEEERQAVARSLFPPDGDDSEHASSSRKERREKKTNTTDREPPSEEGAESAGSRQRERKRRRDDEYPGLKDVTNSPRSRALLPPLDTNASDRDRQHTPETEGPTPISAATSLATTRSFLSTPATTPATTPQINYLPTPRASSSPVPPPCATSASESEAPAGGRERRARKSVNYTEPKLNTKMRKPDSVPPSGTSAPKKRSSTSSARGEETEARRSSLEGPAPPEPMPSPPRLLVTRTTSSTSTSGASSSGTIAVKRKKSRPYVHADDEDESEGTQADAEYGGWVNLDGRRRSTQHNTNTNGTSSRRLIEADDGRRHSLAV
ncbi:hypothetical protein BJ138DRAFT_1172733 [Hygrophoropsis aurantiaca]|uniref:Uncharacterized protein n=1 Tax=Hygrophoropsis aurantiaca TaxID=72124 RepID=A0ACB8ADE0_9AGAM|nr:hypothetical protein BJ138DRAFT_1172733 [Hygrophoropsis aurantiaca]